MPNTPLILITCISLQIDCKSLDLVKSLIGNVKICLQSDVRQSKWYLYTTPPKQASHSSHETSINGETGAPFSKPRVVWASSACCKKMHLYRCCASSNCLLSDMTLYLLVAHEKIFLEFSPLNIPNFAIKKIWRFQGFLICVHTVDLDCAQAFEKKNLPSILWQNIEPLSLISRGICRSWKMVQ